MAIIILQYKNTIMKKIFLFSILLLTSTVSTQMFAQNSAPKQKKENPKESEGDVKLEIKNGEVYLNGEKVVQSEIEKNDDGKIIRKKIIINGKELSEDEMQDFNFNFENTDNKPMLGVSTKPSKNNDGAEVERVVPNSPAQKIGLQEGDIITRVNNQNIYGPKDLVDAIGTFAPGTEIDLTYERNNKMMSNRVVLSSKKEGNAYGGMMPFGNDFFRQFEGGEGPFTMNPYRQNMASNQSPKIGVRVEDRADGEGVLVYEVVENSAAQKAGIEKNDVIVVFHSKEIASVDDLMEAIADAKSKDKVFVDIKRNGVKRQISLNIPKNLKKRDL